MKKLSKDRAAFNIIAYLVIIIMTLFCIVPLIIVISGSFTSESYILKHGFSLIPKEFTTSAYALAFKEPMVVLKAYGVTIFITIAGTFVGLLVTAMTAYVLTRKDFEWRNKFSFYFYFTTLFTGGLVPWYILMVRYLGMKDNYLALILPLLLSVFNILIMKSYMSSIPDAISESAKIDGAGDFTIFIKLILPLSKPALATVGLFIALRYWNDWYNAMLFIQNDKMYSLQYFLYKIVNNIDAYKNILATSGGSVNVKMDLPSESLKMALTVIVTGPIIFLYPFVQKYFVQGLTIGAVKG
ncbi:carbohydrate ABC transporter permease [Clostridium estertheticum]|uniref:Sugar ABC transporter permease n=1 Tax=Clostridium estertheticum subsp. estertheticum TaxID=1552 RepID=A0A1J0GEK7_9CLOT|nr:carbohydrate ABC transporter permease [Clostridium estertheticum]APC39342.1 sugar ABC transporter permease [Clostridium estertheticum subsp. estertheticum]MBU3072016.1 carbohydrate ABC transporter permease [Clostridium estertheticum]MBU3162108.1 carbohydrate ABC transporter permease [Clostridium estertheticum]MBU3184830.1 carbohydrate ABC transporter permease [Clostridium estertheticum]MBZ9614641.1 carbohydrate ABC transporter permease [Clostridium estertheticum subsp. laramiense]